MKKTTIFLLLITMIFTFASCKKEYEKGTIASTTYESKFLNLKFTTPAGYTLKTDEPDGVSEVITGVDVAEFFSDTKVGHIKANAIYEMEATTTTMYPYVAVTLEELPDSDMKLDEYIKIVEDASIANEKYSIAGEEYIKIMPTTTLKATDEMDFYCRIQDGYLVTIIITYSADSVSQKEALLNAFTALK